MDFLTATRNRIQSRIFNIIGCPATVFTLTSVMASNGGYDGSGNTWDAGTAITVVPYDTMHDTKIFKPFGDIANSETAFLLLYNQSIKKDDKITCLGRTYLISRVSDLILYGGIIAKVVIGQEAD